MKNIKNILTAKLMRCGGFAMEYVMEVHIMWRNVDLTGEIVQIK